MVIKLLILLISLVVGIAGIICLSKIPNGRYTVKGNYWRISIYSNIGSFVDFVLFWIIVYNMPQGDYGTGVEVMMFCLTLLLYGIPCVITSRRLKKRMLNYNKEHKTNRINGLNLSVIFKAMFILVETIWLLEVK